MRASFREVYSCFKQQVGVQNWDVEVQLDKPCLRCILPHVSCPFSMTAMFCPFATVNQTSVIVLIDSGQKGVALTAATAAYTALSAAAVVYSSDCLAAINHCCSKVHERALPLHNTAAWLVAVGRWLNVFDS
jgi:hypothetical protein